MHVLPASPERPTAAELLHALVESADNGRSTCADRPGPAGRLRQPAARGCRHLWGPCLRPPLPAEPLCLRSSPAAICSKVSDVRTGLQQTLWSTALLMQTRSCGKDDAGCCHTAKAGQRAAMCCTHLSVPVERGVDPRPAATPRRICTPRTRLRAAPEGRAAYRHGLSCTGQRIDSRSLACVCTWLQPSVARHTCMQMRRVPGSACEAPPSTTASSASWRLASSAWHPHALLSPCRLLPSSGLDHTDQPDLL